MICPTCGSDRTEHHQKLKHGWTIRCLNCKTISKKIYLPRGRCACGLKKTECSGDHRKWVEYDKLMGDDIYYQTRQVTEYIAPISGRGK